MNSEASGLRKEAPCTATQYCEDDQAGLNRLTLRSMTGFSSQ